MNASSALAGEALHQIAADVGGDAVVPARAGGELKRQLGQLRRHRLEVDGRYIRPPVERIHRMLIHEAVGEAGGVGEQMLDGHRRGRLLRRVAVGVSLREDFQIAPEVDGVRHRIVQLKTALLVEHHQRRAGDGLGHRIEAHHRIALHRLAALHVAQPASVEERLLAAPRHQAQRTGELALVDIAVEVRGDARQPVRDESVGHACSLNRGRSITERRCRAVEPSVCAAGR